MDFFLGANFQVFKVLGFSLSVELL